MSTTIYKVKNIKTGQFLDKSLNWSKKGKTWESLGKLKASLNMNGFGPGGYREGSDFGDHAKIIEIEIIETEGNTSNLDDFIEKNHRYAELGKKYGKSFQDLVERIETQGQTKQFKWVLTAKTHYDYDNNRHGGDFGELLDIIKDMKLKQNKDFKKASIFYEGGCIAFSSKQIAMAVRLRMSGKCQGVDIQDYLETNLDD